MNDNVWIEPTSDIFPDTFSARYRASLARELADEQRNGTAYAFQDGTTGQIGVWLPLQQLSIPIEHYPLCSMLRTLERALAALDMKGDQR